MDTRKRIKLSEKPLMNIWQQLVGKELLTEDGEQFRIIYPGRANGDSGPDFRDVVLLKSGCNLIKGDVEIHVSSADWYSHGHHRDSGYNGVVLHAVARHDGRSVTTKQNGELIPVLCLTHVWQQEVNSHLPCQGMGRGRDKRILQKLLDLAGEERFRQKAASFLAELREEEAGQVFWKGVMRASGYSKNMEPFEELAARLPVHFLEGTELRESLLLKQVWLLGVAGLLPCQRDGRQFRGEGEAKRWEEIWRMEGKDIRTMKEGDWQLSRIYPNNHPVRRIIAQSYLLQRYRGNGLLEGMLRKVKEAALRSGFHGPEGGLVVFDDGYWQSHYDFERRTRKSALLGQGKAAEIIINVVLPFAFAWGEMSGEAELKTRAIGSYLCYPGLAGNTITRHMTGQLGLEDSSEIGACSQQGLIHIFRNYCREGKCSQCLLAS
ncbi:MAG: DUF2851 family protein [Chloroflexota bacterium]|nr:DUF2851 family protein [Chloroflexota bacterium]